MIFLTALLIDKSFVVEFISSLLFSSFEGVKSEEDGERYGGESDERDADRT